jgi:transposase InsO family protein
MEEKLRFILEYEQRERTMTELCERYQIARETGYVWVRRYRAVGWEGLLERSRARQQHQNQTPEDIERMVLELRQAHMNWGPRKLKRVLERDEPGRVWPAASTIGAVLKRAGVAVGQRKRCKTPPYSEPLAHADGPNRVWCGDFKGWFRTRDGERIDPLTISDAHSRYLLRCQAVEKTDTARVQAILEAAFREHGMPEAIRTDNGAPFASRAMAGLSRLAVWWMKLGIVPERIEAGHPEQNGRHERMHRTLKQETATPPAANRREQQRVMDRFRQEYNQVRPHEALEMETPAAVYEPSPRRFPARLPEPEYPETMLIRTVQQKGHFRWKKQEVFVSEVLWGERVGLQPVDDHLFTVYFCQFPIARFDSRHAYLMPLPKAEGGYKTDAGKGEASPSLHPIPSTRRRKCQECARSKVSGMCPAVQESDGETLTTEDTKEHRGDGRSENGKFLRLIGTDTDWQRSRI